MILHTKDSKYSCRVSEESITPRLASSTVVTSDIATNPVVLTSATTLRNRLVVLLAVTSGVTDAVGFLALGSAFTSVMTGNLVLFGIGAAHHDTAAVLLTVVAIGSFVTGAAIGARVAGNPASNDPVWPHRVTVALRIELALFTGVAVAWWAFQSHPPVAAFMPVLALNAAALGLQSSAIQRFGVSGLSTTYLTGTLTSVTIRLASGRGLKEVGHSLAIICGLIIGAVLGATLTRYLPVLVPLAQLLTVGGVLFIVRYCFGQTHSRSS